MPKRYDTKKAINYLYSHGYRITDQKWHYQNMTKAIPLYDLINKKLVNLSLNQVEKLVSRKRNPRLEYTPTELDKMFPQEQPTIIQPTEKNTFTLTHQKIPDYTNQLKQACDKNSTVIFYVNRDSAADEKALKDSLIFVLDTLKSKLLKHDIRVTLTSADGTQKYFHLNENSFDLLESAFFADDIPDINDSNTEILYHYYIKELASVTFDIKPPKKPSRINPGFFPFVNKSTIDLTEYGIYNSAEDPMLFKESCLITAIRNSGILDEQDFNRLQHFIQTRTYLLEELPLICKEFNVNIVLHMFSERTNKINMREYAPGADSVYKSPKENAKTIKLIIMYGHYMVDKKLDLKNYPEFKNITNICTLINKLINSKQLVPMTDEEMINIMANFNKTDNVKYNFQRPVQIKIPQRKQTNPLYTSKAKRTKFFFGYKPEPNEIDARLSEIQSFVNKLPLRQHIDVKQYYRYSTLMQRIMFEFGCYDNVYESSGIDNIMLRQSINYPKPHSDYNEGKPFEIIDQGKLYYIDMNSSYLSFVNGVPTDLTMQDRNYSINKLIKLMYNYRRKIKQTHPKLATTIKFLMNSCYGYSLRKPKYFKRKHTSNIENYINKYSSFIFATYNDQSSVNEGFVYSKASFAPDYNTLQFGADIINNYNNFMNKINNIVKVLYSNIDAILITEDDYNKLKELGYIGEELGQFKIEHIFDRFIYKSGRKWQGYLNNEIIEQRGKWT